MASIRLPLFDFTLGQNGERGSSSLEWRTSSADQQVSTLLYCMGEEAGDVVSSTNITEEECYSHGHASLQSSLFLKELASIGATSWKDIPQRTVQ